MKLVTTLLYTAFLTLAQTPSEPPKVECTSCSQLAPELSQKQTEQASLQAVLAANKKRLETEKKSSATIKINSNIFIVTTKLEILSNDILFIKSKLPKNCASCFSNL